MNEQPLALRIEVAGLHDTRLADQSLRNLWQPGVHLPEERLATLHVRSPLFRCDLLEKLTWSLLAWPGVDVIWLEDKASGALVGRLERAGAQAGRSYRWRDGWLSECVRTAALEPSQESLVEFPPGREAAHAGAAGWGRVFAVGAAVTSETGIASCERLKRRLQEVLGHAITRKLQRFYKWLGARRRRARRLSCPAEASIEALVDLTAVPPPDARTLLMVVPRLSPGGAEKSAIELAEQLLALGWRVCLVTTLQSANTWSERAISAGIQVRHMPDFLPASCWLAYLDTLVRAWRIDVLHIANSHWMYEQLPALKRRHPDLPVVTQLHAEGEPGSLDFPELAAGIDALVDRHTVISRHLANYMMSRHGLAEGRLRVIRTGVDLGADFDPACCRRGAWRRAHGIGSDRRLVCFVGRFSELKRPLLFLDIAETVLGKFPDTRFVIKGEGPLLAELEGRIQRSTALSDAVLLEDAVDPVPPLMCDADLLVLPSRMEGIAYVSYEAMALGLPQVSADVGGQSELLGHGAGRLIAVGPGEVDRFAKAIVDLLEDSAARSAMSRTARDQLEAWQTVEKMASEYDDLYTSLATGRGRRP